MAEEITNETTPEEIKGFVDTIAAERAGQEPEKSPAKEPVSDAAIINGHADNVHKEKPAVPKDDETAAAPKKGKGETADDRAWLDDDLKSEVSAYGISEEALADFTSREEVERAMRFFDRSALEAGRKALADGKAEGEAKGATRDDKGRFVKSETEKAEPEKTPEPKPGGYEPKLDKSIYDDEIVNEFTRMRDHYESRLEAFKQQLDTLGERFAQADALAEEQRFDGLVDALGHTDLFGKTAHENEKQLQRRKDLYENVKALIIGQETLGRPTEMSESLINRVAKMVFAEELGKKELKSRTAKITRQSNGRQGGSVTRPSEPREDPRDEADRLYEELKRA